jgi:hypothetical protein
MANWPSERTNLLPRIRVHITVGGRKLPQPKRSGKRPRKDGESGAPVPADPGPKPVPLEGGAEAPLD